MVCNFAIPFSSTGTSIVSLTVVVSFTLISSSVDSSSAIAKNVFLRKIRTFLTFSLPSLFILC